MKFFFISLSAVLVLSATSCKPETKIAGQPVSHWIERLDDANPHTRNDAWRQLHFASDDDIRKNKKSFERIAERQSGDADRAVWMLHERLGEVNIKWLNVYLSEEISSYSIFYGWRGAQALKQLEMKDRQALKSGLERYIAEGALAGAGSNHAHVAGAEYYLKHMNKAAN